MDRLKSNFLCMHIDLKYTLDDYLVNMGLVIWNPMEFIKNHFWVQGAPNSIFHTKTQNWFFVRSSFLCCGIICEKVMVYIYDIYYLCEGQMNLANYGWWNSGKLQELCWFFYFSNNKSWTISVFTKLIKYLVDNSPLIFQNFLSNE